MLAHTNNVIHSMQSTTETQQWGMCRCGTHLLCLLHSCTLRLLAHPLRKSLQKATTGQRHRSPAQG